MTAFSHQISINPSVTQDVANEIRFVNKLALPHSLERKIVYNQNQNRDVTLSTDKSFEHNQKDQQWLFKIENVVSFHWLHQENRVFYQLHTEGNEALLQYWLLHTFMPLYLSIEGKFELIHGAGVTINDQAVLFIAPSYAGKSTLTDYFIQQGHPMISDDRVGLYESDGEIRVVSSYPFHRPYRQMEDLGLAVSSFLEEEKDLHVIYVLAPVEEDQDVTFEPLLGIEKFKALQYNFDFELPLNKVKTFELIGRISALTAVYKVSIPRNLDKLSKVYDAICTHSLSLNKEN